VVGRLLRSYAKLSINTALSPSHPHTTNALHVDSPHHLGPSLRPTTKALRMSVPSK
jgi:hypothetical protein